VRLWTSLEVEREVKGRKVVLCCPILIRRHPRSSIVSYPREAYRIEELRGRATAVEFGCCATADELEGERDGDEGVGGDSFEGEEAGENDDKRGSNAQVKDYRPGAFS
jgi:hypothetical protein